MPLLKNVAGKKTEWHGHLARVYPGIVELREITSILKAVFLAFYT
jgi:hypothetical protein